MKRKRSTKLNPCEEKALVTLQAQQIKEKEARAKKRAKKTKEKEGKVVLGGQALPSYSDVRAPLEIPQYEREQIDTGPSLLQQNLRNMGTSFASNLINYAFMNAGRWNEVPRREQEQVRQRGQRLGGQAMPDEATYLDWNANQPISRFRRTGPYIPSNVPNAPPMRTSADDDVPQLVVNKEARLKDIFDKAATRSTLREGFKRIQENPGTMEYQLKKVFGTVRNMDAQHVGNMVLQYTQPIDDYDMTPKQFQEYRDETFRLYDVMSAMPDTPERDLLNEHINRRQTVIANHLSFTMPKEMAQREYERTVDARPHQISLTPDGREYVAMDKVRVFKDGTVVGMKQTEGLQTLEEKQRILRNLKLNSVLQRVSQRVDKQAAIDALKRNSLDIEKNQPLTDDEKQLYKLDSLNSVLYKNAQRNKESIAKGFQALKQNALDVGRKQTDIASLGDFFERNAAMQQANSVKAEIPLPEQSTPAMNSLLPLSPATEQGSAVTPENTETIEQMEPRNLLSNFDRIQSAFTKNRANKTPDPVNSYYNNFETQATLPSAISTTPDNVGKTMTSQASRTPKAVTTPKGLSKYRTQQDAGLSSPLSNVNLIEPTTEQRYVKNYYQQWQENDDEIQAVKADALVQKARLATAAAALNKGSKSTLSAVRERTKLGDEFELPDLYMRPSDTQLGRFKSYPYVIKELLYHHFPNHANRVNLSTGQVRDLIQDGTAENRDYRLNQILTKAGIPRRQTPSLIANTAPSDSNNTFKSPDALMNDESISQSIEPVNLKENYDASVSNLNNQAKAIETKRINTEEDISETIGEGDL